MRPKKRSKEQIGYRETLLSLSSNEKNVRLEAVKTLGKSGEKNIIPILAKKLEDPDLRVRQTTAQVLHKIIDQAISIS